MEGTPGHRVGGHGGQHQGEDQAEEGSQFHQGHGGVDDGKDVGGHQGESNHLGEEVLVVEVEPQDGGQHQAERRLHQVVGQDGPGVQGQLREEGRGEENPVQEPLRVGWISHWLADVDGLLRHGRQLAQSLRHDAVAEVGERQAQEGGQVGVEDKQLAERQRQHEGGRRVKRRPQGQVEEVVREDGGVGAAPVDLGVHLCPGGVGVHGLPAGGGVGGGLGLGRLQTSRQVGAVRGLRDPDLVPLSGGERGRGQVGVSAAEKVDRERHLLHEYAVHEVERGEAQQDVEGAGGHPEEGLLGHGQAGGVGEHAQFEGSVGVPRVCVLGVCRGRGGLAPLGARACGRPTPTSSSAKVQGWPRTKLELENLKHPTVGDQGVVFREFLKAIITQFVSLSYGIPWQKNIMMTPLHKRTEPNPSFFFCSLSYPRQKDAE